jgi:hypothetical protein
MIYSCSFVTFHSQHSHTHTTHSATHTLSHSPVHSTTVLTDLFSSFFATTCRTLCIKSHRKPAFESAGRSKTRMRNILWRRRWFSPSLSLYKSPPLISPLWRAHTKQCARGPKQHISSRCKKLRRVPNAWTVSGSFFVQRPSSDAADCAL